MRRTFAVVTAIAALVAACSSGTASPSSTSPSPTARPSEVPTVVPTSTPTPEPSFVEPPGTSSPSATRILQWATDALAFADAFNAAYSDPEAAFVTFADDAKTRDPSNGDYLFDGKAAIVSAWKGLVRGWPDLDARATAVYVTSDSALFATDVDNLVEDTLHELRRYRWAGNRIVEFELWYRVDQLGGCQPDGCAVEAQGFASRYLAAWSGGGADAIAAMYRDDATFSDSLLGIEVEGSAAIAQIADQRFGTGAPSCSVIDLAGLTNGGERIIGLAIHALCVPASGEPAGGVESVFVLRFGAYAGEGFEVDSGGLVTSEDVYHDAESLAASSLLAGS